MAFMDKLKFWKKHDDFADMDRELNTLKPKDQLGLPSKDPISGTDTTLDFGHEEDMSFGMTPPNDDNVFSRQPQRPLQYERPHQQSQPSISSTQLDLIAAKLETIKVSLESINHRLVAVEHALRVRDYQETEEPRRRRGVW